MSTPSTPSASPTEAAVPEKQPRRTPAEIEAEIAKTRAELSQTVDELAERLDPRVIAKDAIANTKEIAADAVTHTREIAADAVSHVEGAVEQTAHAAKKYSDEFVHDVKDRQPRALAILGAGVAAVAAAVVIAILRSRRR